MRGTGSHDMRVDEVFVPLHRAAATPFLPILIGQSDGQARHADPMYHLPFIPIQMSEVVPVLIGAARRHQRLRH